MTEVKYDSTKAQTDKKRYPSSLELTPPDTQERPVFEEKLPSDTQDYQPTFETTVSPGAGKNGDATTHKPAVKIPFEERKPK